MKFSSNLNRMFGNHLTLTLPMDLRVRVSELNEYSFVQYNGSLCIFRYKKDRQTGDDVYEFIKNLPLFEAYFTINSIKEYIQKFFPDFGSVIEEKVDSKTFKIKPTNNSSNVVKPKKDEDLPYISLKD